jgi:FG-GAP-like repeat
MRQPTSKTLAFLAGAGLLGFAGTANAQFVIDNATNPTGAGIASSTENVDFGDVDLDGDWDAVFADGGDDGNDQNRIWINRGGLQAGPIGQFLDQTSTRFPVLNDDSRDIEFVDFDNDGDLDIYSSNTAQLSNQGNHWWTNRGGIQGGTLGIYTDETTTRWVGLGGPGSSIPPGLLIGGTFIDWSCDCDFGDLDNDGDLDLVHSSYGGAFGGNVPTRIFLNDGTGKFSEFNPSGFQLTTNNISNGNPALWAEGTQQANTTNNTGLQADVASSALDIDVADFDNDYDLDILHGARQEVPRIFRNRLQENGGSTLGFRDVTTAAFPAGYATGAENYEQEYGDFDGDGDMDIYGLNWPGFNDSHLRNNGSMVFTQIQVLPGSGADDNEGDYLDYDRDGDMDLYVANFSGADKLYRNDGTGIMTLQQNITGGAPSLDADCVDFDGDGDCDIMVAEDNFAANLRVINTLNVVDTRAPYIPRFEAISNQTAAAAKLIRRAQVYDNEAYYVTWYHPTFVNLSVNGFALPPIKAMSSAGQVFRAALPGNLVGSVSGNWTSTDKYGNTGTSTAIGYTGSTAASYYTPYGISTLGTNGSAPTIAGLSVPFAGTTLYLGLQGAASTPYFYYMTDLSIPTTPLPGLALLNIGGTILLNLNGTLNASGRATLALPVGPSIPAGLTVYQQLFTLNGVGDLLASSLGYGVTTQ